MPAAGKRAAIARFIQFLSGQRLRLTAQRRAIVDAAFSTEEHFTADQLLGWSRQRDGSVSRATVYRTLPLLTRSGLVREMDLGKDQKVYDPNHAEHPDHSHIICEDCDRIVEFEDATLARLEKKIVHRLGFRPKGVRLHITASCEELKRAGACRNKG